MISENTAGERVNGAISMRSLAADLDRTFEPLVVAYQERIYRFALRYSGTARMPRKLPRTRSCGPIMRCRLFTERRRG